MYSVYLEERKHAEVNLQTRRHKVPQKNYMFGRNHRILSNLQSNLILPKIAQAGRQHKSLLTLLLRRAIETKTLLASEKTHKNNL